MGVKRTILAAIAFAAALALLIFDGRRLDELERRRLESRRLFAIEFDRIASISMIRRGVPLELRLEDGEWRIIQPISNSADPQTVADLLFYLNLQEIGGAARADQEALKRYGLAQPALKVSVADESGQRSPTLLIGEDTPVHGEVYARLDGSSETFTVSADLRNHLLRPLRDYRDKSLFSFNVTESRRLSITDEGTTLEVEKQEEGWRLTRPSPERADDEAVEDILREMQATRAEDFIDTETLNLAGFGLEANPLVVIAETGEEQGEDVSRGTLLVGNRLLEKEDIVYYAQRTDRDQIFTVPHSLVVKLRPTVLDLRSKTLFTLEPREVAHFALRFGNRMFRLDRSSSGLWTFAESPEEKLDQAFVNRLAGQLMGIKVAQYFSVQPTPEQSGLEEPIIFAVLSDATEERREGIETGLRRNRDLVYAQSVDGEEVFGIDGGLPSKFFVSRESFLDKTLYSFDPGLVATVQVTANGRNLYFHREADVWIGSIEGRTDSYQVNTTLIYGLIANLLDMKWQNHLDPKIETERRLIEANGLETPSRTIAFLDENGGELAVVDQGDQDEKQVFIRRDGLDSFTVDRAVYARFTKALTDLMPRP